MAETKPKKPTVPRAPRRPAAPRMRPAAAALAPMKAAVAKEPARTAAPRAKPVVPAPAPVRNALPREEPRSAPRHYFTGVGRRKEAIMKVKLIPVSSHPEASVNGKPFLQYFPFPGYAHIAMAALEATGAASRFSIVAHARGGGAHAPAVAMRMGTARALVKQDQNLRPQLRALGFLPRDSRAKERKKPGLKRARRAPQFSKR